MKDCIRNGALAPTSSNLQLWEFIHITDPQTLERLSGYCFDQNAAKTAQQIVVVVARRDLWRKRAKANLGFLDTQFEGNTDEKWQRRRKMALNYYSKLIPTPLYGVPGDPRGYSLYFLLAGRAIQAHIPAGPEIRPQDRYAQKRCPGSREFYDFHGSHRI